MSDLTPDVLVLGFIYYIVFLFSTTCHEAAHAFAAKWGGDETGALAGQASLNPIPHIRREFFGMVVVPILYFFVTQGGGMLGWASTPYDPLWERRHPKRSAWMSLAGPAANFSLMILAAIAIRVGGSMGLYGRTASGRPDFTLVVLGVFFSLNLLLGTFNLLPFPPLDGSTGIMLFMSEERAQKYLDWIRGNRFGMAGLLIGVVVFREIYPYVRYFVSSLLLR